MKDNKKTCSKCEERAIHCHGRSDNEVFFCQKHEDEYQIERERQKANNETTHCDKCDTDIVNIDFPIHLGKSCDVLAEISKTVKETKGKSENKNQKEPVKKKDPELLKIEEPEEKKNSETIDLLLSLDQVEEYFIRESISKIERKDGRLIITFTDEKSIDKNTLTIKEQQKLNQFLTTSNLKELSREELDNRLRLSYKSTNKDHARGGIPASA